MRPDRIGTSWAADTDLTRRYSYNGFACDLASSFCAPGPRSARARTAASDGLVRGEGQRAATSTRLPHVSVVSDAVRQEALEIERLPMLSLDEVALRIRHLDDDGLDRGAWVRRLGRPG